MRLNFRPATARRSLQIAIAAAALSLMGAGSAQAADTILHYTFDAGSYFNLVNTSERTVTGSFDYDVTTNTLANVNYHRGLDTFTVGSLYYGAAQPLFGVFGSDNYDVYQLNNSLALGGTDLILGGTHPSIVVDGAGVSVTATDAAAAVPEPATWALMLAGFGMIGFAMRKRGRTTVAYS